MLSTPQTSSPSLTNLLPSSPPQTHWEIHTEITVVCLILLYYCLFSLVLGWLKNLDANKFRWNFPRWHILSGNRHRHTFGPRVSCRPQVLSWFHPRLRGWWFRQTGRLHPSISTQWHSTHLSVRHKPLFLCQNSQTSSYSMSAWSKDTWNFVLKKLTSTFLSTPNPRSQTSLVFRLAL